MARRTMTAAEKAAWKKKMDAAKKAKAKKRKSPKKSAAKKPSAKKSAAKKSAPKKAAPRKAARRKPRAKKKSATLASALKKLKAKKASPPKTGTKRRRRNTLKGAMARLGAKKAAPPKTKTAKRRKPKRRAASAGLRPRAAVLGHAPLRGSCVKCGEPHSLSSHWSHLANHGTGKTKHSYLCARGGFCVFDAESKKRKLSERNAMFAEAARIEATRTKNKSRRAKLLLDYEKLAEKSGARRTVSPLAPNGAWRPKSPSYVQQRRR